jgi:hypothetical protein
MAFTVIFSAEFRDWFDEQDKALQRAILFYTALLEEHGPQLSRPHADTLKGSKLTNLKELRVQYRGDPYRVLYAFDPKRQALLLVGGNKASDKKWYERMMKAAETIFEAHLEKLRKEEEDEKNKQKQKERRGKH